MFRCRSRWYVIIGTVQGVRCAGSTRGTAQFVSTMSQKIKLASRGLADTSGRSLAPIWSLSNKLIQIMRPMVRRSGIPAGLQIDKKADRQDSDPDGWVGLIASIIGRLAGHVCWIRLLVIAIELDHCPMNNVMRVQLAEVTCGDAGEGASFRRVDGSRHGAEDRREAALDRRAVWKNPELACTRSTDVLMREKHLLQTSPDEGPVWMSSFNSFPPPLSFFPSSCPCSAAHLALSFALYVYT